MRLSFLRTCFLFKKRRLYEHLFLFEQIARMKLLKKRFVSV